MVHRGTYNEEQQTFGHPFALSCISNNSQLYRHTAALVGNGLTEQISRACETAVAGLTSSVNRSNNRHRTASRKLRGATYILYVPDVNEWVWQKWRAQHKHTLDLSKMLSLIYQCSSVYYINCLSQLPHEALNVMIFDQKCLESRNYEVSIYFNSLKRILYQITSLTSAALKWLSGEHYLADFNNAFTEAVFCPKMLFDHVFRVFQKCTRI